MIKKTLYRLLMFFTTALAILAILFFTTKMPNKQNNGFNRNLIQSNLSIVKNRELPENLVQICGGTQNTLYLKGDNPKAILVIDKNFNIQDTLFLNLKVPIKKMAPCTVQVDSPNIYLHFNNLKQTYFGKIPNGTLTFSNLNSNIFSKSVQISPSSLIIRSFDSTLINQTFKKMNCLTGAELNSNKIVKSNNDAGASTDGILLFNKNNANIFYVEYFQNIFYRLDTNLNIIYKGATIDTISNPNIKISLENNTTSNKLTPTNARTVVNKIAFLNNDYLFIVSGLRSDNETIKDFATNEVIDVYKISTGKYLRSFHIPKVNNKPIKSVYLDDKELIVLFPGEIVTFHLPALS